MNNAGFAEDSHLQQKSRYFTNLTRIAHSNITANTAVLYSKMTLIFAILAISLSFHPVTLHVIQVNNTAASLIECI
jgi:hypothetical protein